MPPCPAAAVRPGRFRPSHPARYPSFARPRGYVGVTFVTFRRACARSTHPAFLG